MKHLIALHAAVAAALVFLTGFADAEKPAAQASQGGKELARSSASFPAVPAASKEASSCSLADAALHAFRKEEGRIIGRSWREAKTKKHAARQGFYILDRQGRFVEIAVLDTCKRNYQAKVVIESPFAERKFTLQESGQASARALLYYDPNKRKKEKELTFETKSRPDFYLVRIKEAGRKQPVKLYVSRWSGRVAESADLMNDAAFHFACSPDLGFIPQIAKEGGRKILSIRQKGERIYEARFVKGGRGPAQPERLSGKPGATTSGGSPAVAAAESAQPGGGAKRGAAETVLQTFKIPSQSCLIERWMRWGPRAVNL